MIMDPSFLTDFSLINLLLRFILNLTVLFVLIGLIYYRFTKKPEYVFQFVLIGNMIFMICSIMKTIDLPMGVAFGLFAIFAIIRFRTVQYSVRDITYIFIMIGVSVINSQANIAPPIISAAVINLSTLLLTFLLETFLRNNHKQTLSIIYNKPELLKPGNIKELLNDLSLQTGQNIERVVIKKIDIGKGNAEIELHYRNINEEPSI